MIVGWIEGRKERGTGEEKEREGGWVRRVGGSRRKVRKEKWRSRKERGTKEEGKKIGMEGGRLHHCGEVSCLPGPSSAANDDIVYSNHNFAPRVVALGPIKHKVT